MCGGAGESLHLFYYRGMNQAARIVNAAIIGADFKTVVVNGKAYTVKPPTIAKIAGAGYHLAGINDGDSLKDILLSLGDLRAVSAALSWLIQGDDKLADELSEGEFSEVVNALDEALSLISPEGFTKLLVLTRSVLKLTAKQK